MSGRITYFLFLALLLLLPSFAGAAVWVVRADGSGDVPTIQDAIAVLDYDDVIELADGVYTGPGNRDLHNSEKSFAIVSQSGDPTACIIDCESTEEDPHFGIIFDGGG